MDKKLFMTIKRLEARVDQLENLCLEINNYIAELESDMEKDREILDYRLKENNRLLSGQVKTISDAVIEEVKKIKKKEKEHYKLYESFSVYI